MERVHQLFFECFGRSMNGWIVYALGTFYLFSVADKRLYKRLYPSIRWSVGEHESKSGETRISAPAHPSATGIGRVSGLVSITSTHLIRRKHAYVD